VAILKLQHGRTALSFHRKTGLPVALEHTGTGRNYLQGVKQPFFVITIRNRDGSKSVYTGFDAATAHVKETESGATVYYNFLGQRNLSVKCHIAYGTYTDFELGFEVRNESGCAIIDIEYPILLLPEELEGGGSDWVLWHHCFFNGILTRGFDKLMTGPSWLMESGFASPIQMCACGTSTESLYFCTMDTDRYSKDMQPVWTGTNAKLSSVHHVDEVDHSRFRMPYASGFGFLDSSEWYDAAEKYRDWAERQYWCAAKLWERDDVAAWWLESPIVLAIKERGKRNKEIGQQPSAWCHPLVNGVERILQLAERFDSTVNVQVFHWEKNGAFLNGDHFPPLSGYDGMQAFFDRLHEHGHRGGVYILPSKWCLHAETTGYDGSEFFDEHDAIGSVCCDENMNPICSNYDWEWRKRYMICAVTPEGRNEIVEAFRVFNELGADYIQWDTFNGRLRHCWNEKHGHYPGNGRWQHETPLSIMEEIRAQSRETIVTVEAQPAEWLIPKVHGFVERGVHPKAEKGWETIPLYQYIYHQYVQGFAGEDHGAFNTPDNFFLMTGITIVSGDMLMISLNGEGKIAMISHEVHQYDQTVESVYPAELIETYIRDLNRLRREYAREFLVTGRMEKPPVIECGTGKVLEAEFHKLHYPAVLGSSWTSPDGRKGTVLVNYTNREQTFRIRFRYDAGKSVTVTDARGNKRTFEIADGGFEAAIGPYAAWVVTNG